MWSFSLDELVDFFDKYIKHNDARIIFYPTRSFNVYQT